MNAYKATYLNNAANILGSMMDYAVNDCGLDGGEFLHMFIVSGLAEQFGRGNPKIIAGMSGLELAIQTFQRVTDEIPSAKPTNTTDYRTPEFWAGWVLAHYQWRSAKSFASILRSFPFEEIVSRYYPLHEADISKFYTIADSIISEANPQTNLKRLREAADLSQLQLAQESGAPLRSIQMYEQRSKDVNKAQAITLARIARVLGCDVEDLLESEVID